MKLIVLLFVLRVVGGCGPTVEVTPRPSPDAGPQPAQDAGLDADCTSAPSTILDAGVPTCSDAGPCAVVTPNRDGTCTLDVVPGCMPCVDGCGQTGTARASGGCCTTCWAGSACVLEPSAVACGHAGGLCVPCDGTKTCVDGVCDWRF